MISLRTLASLAFALSLVPTLAPADEPTLSEWAHARVEAGLVKPLAERETHTFSRSRPPPRERRVRITQASASLDGNKRSFLRFAIDVRFGGSEWHEDDVVGCVYAGSGKLFVKRGDSYRPASFLLGKNEDPVAGVCEAAARS